MNTYDHEVSFFIELMDGADKATAKSELEKLADDLTVTRGIAGSITTGHTSKATYERVFNVTLHPLGGGTWYASPRETIPDPVKEYIARVELSRKLGLH
jgi:hypothetical protein